MKALLTLMAVLEASVGLALLVSPALSLSIFLGAPLDTPAVLTVGRVAGSALLALGIACWRVRQDGRSCSAIGIVTSMMFYNVLVVAILLYAQHGLGVKGIGVRPAVFLHVVLAVWCITCVIRPVNSTNAETPVRRARADV
jgi:hypothetical protein